MTGNLQTIVLVLEVVVFAATAGIAWLVWRISKRDSDNKMSKQSDRR